MQSTFLIADQTDKKGHRVLGVVPSTTSLLRMHASDYGNTIGQQGTQPYLAPQIAMR